MLINKFPELKNFTIIANAIPRAQKQTTPVDHHQAEAGVIRILEDGHEVFRIHCCNFKFGITLFSIY